MNSLEDLIAQAMVRMFENDEPCCNRVRHRARALAKAIEEVAREFHVAVDHEVLTKIDSFEACDAFPCRVVE